MEPAIIAILSLIGCMVVLVVTVVICAVCSVIFNCELIISKCCGCICNPFINYLNKKNEDQK